MWKKFNMITILRLILNATISFHVWKRFIFIIFFKMKWEYDLLIDFVVYVVLCECEFFFVMFDAFSMFASCMLSAEYFWVSLINCVYYFLAISRLRSQLYSTYCKHIFLSIFHFHRSLTAIWIIIDRVSM